ncbi:hypothetical protein C1H46_031757 [Malus baccata]|uniref:Uncharacterized protein n=1 Tax=Malus baccata TaxID=106549 RepID=A0A540L8Z0_MALBA|nr:hypothetical protein C1H46_031757 [Malus baccata]
MATITGRVVSYNLGTRKLKYLPIDWFNVDKLLIRAVVYVESIVSVTRGNKKLKGIERNRSNISKIFQKVAKV